VQNYCSFLTCATLSAHFFAEFLSGRWQQSRDLQLAQAVSDDFLPLMERITDLSAASTAASTITPASTY